MSEQAEQASYTETDEMSENEIENSNENKKASSKIKLQCHKAKLWMVSLLYVEKINCTNFVINTFETSSIL